MIDTRVRVACRVVGGLGGRAEPNRQACHVSGLRGGESRRRRERPCLRRGCALNLDAVAVISEVPWKLAPDHTSSIAVSKARFRKCRRPFPQYASVLQQIGFRTFSELFMP
jgi:hypothetical protein